MANLSWLPSTFPRAEDRRTANDIQIRNLRETSRKRINGRNKEVLPNGVWQRRLESYLVGSKAKKFQENITIKWINFQKKVHNSISSYSIQPIFRCKFNSFLCKTALWKNYTFWCFRLPNYSCFSFNNSSYYCYLQYKNHWQIRKTNPDLGRASLRYILFIRNIPTRQSNWAHLWERNCKHWNHFAYIFVFDCIEFDFRSLLYRLLCVNCPRPYLDYFYSQRLGFADCTHQLIHDLVSGYWVYVSLVLFVVSFRAPVSSAEA